MSNGARYIVLIAGVLGVLAMFQPLLAIGRYKLRAEVSAYDLSFGLEKTHKALDTKLPFLVERKIPVDIRDARDDIKIIMDASKNAALAYIPAAVLLLIGAYATWKKRLNRPLAALCVLFGIASAAAYVGLKYGIAYGEQEEPILKRVSIELLIGAKILLAGGVACVVAGLAALVHPNPPASSSREAPADTECRAAEGRGARSAAGSRREIPKLFGATGRALVALSLAMNKTLLVSLLFAVACGKGGGSAAKMKTVDLGDTGYVIDVPDGWSVEVPMKGFFEFKGGRPTPQLMQSSIGAPTLDEVVASRCEGRTVQTKETLPGGGVFVACKGESKMIKGVQTTQIAAYVPMGEHESLMCHLETDKDVETVSKVCKSMRKK